MLEEIKIQQDIDRDVLINIARTSLRTKVNADLADLLTEVCVKGWGQASQGWAKQVKGWGQAGQGLGPSRSRGRDMQVNGWGQWVWPSRLSEAKQINRWCQAGQGVGPSRSIGGATGWGQTGQRWG